MDNTEEYTCLSLCSGYGGLELGLRRACPNIRAIAYVEVEAFACANLVSKMEKGLLDAAPIWTDIKTFNAKLFRDRVHIVTGGYPCQPFSVAGQRKGTDDPRHLWPYIARIVQTVRPVWCFFENVSGHLSLGFPEVYRSLRLMGYKVEAGLFTAAEVGAPHKRERLFILANCQGKYARTLPDKDRIRSAQTQFRGLSTMRNTWPVRPGQPQYEWEEPRVISYTESRTRYSNEQGVRRFTFGISNEKKGLSEKTEIKPQLGGTVNGTNSRVDRLRLLGNGVAPQQAEKAFRTLIKLFE